VAALDEPAFVARVQAAFGWRAGRFLGCGARSRYARMRTGSSGFRAYSG
jgi:2-octaprenyl-6-methoxyphenol hydroxylase